MTISPELDAALVRHRERYDVHYGGGLSDHLPMMMLAGTGLGLSDAELLAMAERYESRNEPLSPESHYARGARRFDDALAERGVAATLRAALPSLASGWVRGAYHPLIRLGYGIEFEHRGEIGAGLAYLASVGTDERLTALAARFGRGRLDPRAAVVAARDVREPNDRVGTFGQRYERLIADPRLARLAEQSRLSHETVPGFARAALDTFAASHDFFALHLVTGTHAYLIARPFLEEAADALYALGILIGYLAIGAPDPEGTAGDDPPPLVIVDDEHDLKLAYSAQWLCRHFDDAGYVEVARRYLGERAAASLIARSTNRA